MEPWLELFARAVFLRSSDTAHDLKTPLNVAVLNLELLRMRVRKLVEGEDDEKLTGYGQAIELELRRMARIFDAFFILSTPPRGEGAPAAIDVSAVCSELAAAAGYAFATPGPAAVLAHASRIREAVRLFLEGAARVLQPEGRTFSMAKGDTHFVAAIEGHPAGEDFELTRIFKFYYTDPAGAADVSLAAARLIAETYGGELNAVEESDKVTLRLSLPLGDQ